MSDKKHMLCWLSLLTPLLITQAARAGEQDVVAALEKLGVKLTRDAKQPGNPVVAAEFPRKVDDLAEELQRNISAWELMRKVQLRDSATRDPESLQQENLRNVKELRTWLELPDAVPDAGVKELAKLSTLRSIRMRWSGLTDEGLRELSALSALRELDLSFTMITDAGLKHLMPLNDLRVLRLRGTQVTDAGMKTIAKLDKLEVLDLKSAWVNETKEFIKLPQLRELVLGLQCWSIQDLVKLKNLNRLEFSADTVLTEKEVQEWKRSLPNCELVGYLKQEELDARRLQQELGSLKIPPQRNEDDELIMTNQGLITKKQMREREERERQLREAARPVAGNVPQPPAEKSILSTLLGWAAIAAVIALIFWALGGVEKWLLRSRKPADATPPAVPPGAIAAGPPPITPGHESSGITSPGP